MRPRSRLLYLGLTLLTMSAGLVLRFAPLGLPAVVTKFGGSSLWAVMVYWLLATAMPRLSPLRLAWVAASATACVEFFKLYHHPSLDLFRLTLPGILLLGRFFSVWDLLVYWLAITVCIPVDQALLRRHAVTRG